MKKFRTITRTDNITREEWLEHRQAGIGGSDASIIMNQNNYKSRFSLWAEKTNTVASDSSAGPAAQWGNDLELVVAKRFAADHNKRVVAWPYLLQSTEHPFMLANLDFLIVDYATFDEFPEGEVTVHNSDEAPNGVSGILEIKTTGIAARGNARGWADGQVPLAYEYQGRHYAAVTGWENVTFACLIGGEGLVVRERTYRDNADLIEEEQAFWECVKSGTYVEVDGSDSTANTISKMYPESNDDEVIEASEAFLIMLEQYTAAKATQLFAEEEAKYWKNAIELAIGTAEAVTFNGDIVLTYKSNKVSNVLDTKALKEAHPEICATFTKERKGARVLRIKNQKEGD